MQLAKVALFFESIIIGKDCGMQKKYEKGNSMKIGIKRDWKKILSWLGMFLCPVAIYYLMEAFHMNAFVMTRWRAQILNILFFELLMLFLFFITGRLRIALVLETVFAFVAGLANFYVLSFRGNPIVPWDIFSIQTAVSVAGSYDYTLGKRQILTISGFLVLLFFEIFFLKLTINTWKLVKRLIAVMCTLALIFGFTKMLQNDTMVSKFRLYPFLFTPAYMSQADGFAVTFLMDLQYLSVEKPEGYSAAQAQEILESYGKHTTEDKTEDMAQMPNIIVVMDEAFSDPAVLGEFTVNQDYMPFVHSLQQGADNTITGLLNVSVKGGNTANTEFEFLTGNTMAFLPAGSIPYQQYIMGEIPSVVSDLKEMGYVTYAMHPYYSTGWNRDKVYPYLGFEHAYFIDAFTTPSYVRKYVDDASCVDKIIEIYENKEAGQPMFLFNVTMQNHSPYTESYMNLKENITVEGANTQALSQYLSLIKLSDAALESLVTYFAGQMEPTVIVFFGDHQPTDSVVQPILTANGISADSLSPEEEAKHYEVPYVIWANYDIREGTNEDISANYLAAKVLDEAGVPLSAYQSYLLELSGEIPVVSSERVVDVDGKEQSVSETEALNTYKKLQYYQLFDATKGE